MGCEDDSKFFLKLYCMVIFIYFVFQVKITVYWFFIVINNISVYVCQLYWKGLDQEVAVLKLHTILIEQHSDIHVYWLDYCIFGVYISSRVGTTTESETRHWQWNITSSFLSPSPSHHPSFCRGVEMLRLAVWIYKAIIKFWLA